MSGSNADDAWNSLQNAADDDETADDVWVIAEELMADRNYTDLMRVGRSARENHGADVTTNDSPKKHEICERLAEAGVFPGLVGDDGFYLRQDGEVEAVDLLPVQTPDRDNSGGSSGPTDTTVLYCLTRQATTEERVAEIREALGSAGYELREAAGGDKYSIVEPAPEPQDEGADEPDEPEEAESGEESGEEEEADERVGDEPDPDAEPESDGESDEGDEDEEEDEDVIPRNVARERLEEKNYDEVYDLATEYDVSGRSDMTKDELVNGVLDANPDIEDAEPVEA